MQGQTFTSVPVLFMNVIPSTVRLNNDKTSVLIIDQTRLPREEVYLELRTAESIWEAIYKLRVRGAPAIGITAAFGSYVCALQWKNCSTETFTTNFYQLTQYLDSSRPTAVNLSAALRRMERVVEINLDQSVSKLLDLLLCEAEAIYSEDAAACRRIGELGLSLLTPGMGLLTHCNAGSLATSEYGTALAPIYLGQEKGYNFAVYTDETRPLLQGARLTAYELSRAKVHVTLICDNMVSIVMSKGWVQAVLVGCDRVAMNGDVANKIGTSGVAILAKHYGIPFYVLGPTSTIDPACKSGESIHIEERDRTEISHMWYENPMAPDGINVFNPSFDVTPYHLITAIVTEKGIAYPPYTDTLSQIIK